MTWSLADVEYWNSSSSWGASPPLFALSGAEETAINGYLTTLYNGSATAEAMFDRWDATGQPMRIGGLYASFGEPGRQFTSSSTGVKFVGYNLGVSGQLYYFNDHGALVQEKPELTVVHELSHMIDGTTDPQGTGSGGALTESDMNAAAFDFKGGAVRAQNAVAAELGFTENIQASYAAVTINPSPLPFTLNHSYTEGNTVDDVRFGDGLANDLDHTARTDDSSDLLFGLDGDDVIKGGTGRDYLYGDGGADTIEASGDNSHLEGGAGDDRLTSAGVATTLVGGAGNDVIDASGMNPDIYLGSTAVFNAGDGHDKIVAREFTPVGSDPFTTTGLDALNIATAESNLRVVWDYTVLEGHHDSGDDFWFALVKGDVVIKLLDTGDTIFFSDVEGTFGDSDHDGTYDNVSIGFGPAVYANGSPDQWTIEVSDVSQADVSQYDIAI